MTIQQLQYFQKLAQNLHLKRTAEEFLVSPPAITAAINRLEDELGVSLFTIKGRKLALTDEGKIFQKHVDSILLTLDKAKDQIRNYTKSSIQPLSIGVVSPILWNRPIEKFILEYPHTKVITTLLTLSMLKKMDILGKFDFIFCDSNLFSNPSFTSYMLSIDNSPCLAVYRSHPLAKRKSISLIEAKDERFIALNSDYCYRAQFDKLCELAGFTPNVILECDFSMRKQLLASKFGVLVTTKSVQRLGDLGDVKYINIIDPTYSRTHSFYVNNNSLINEPAVLFRDFILKYYGINPENKKESGNQAG